MSSYVKQSYEGCTVTFQLGDAVCDSTRHADDKLVVVWYLIIWLFFSCINEWYWLDFSLLPMGFLQTNPSRFKVLGNVILFYPVTQALFQYMFVRSISIECVLCFKHFW
jgi:hypothetical protein